MIVTNKYSNAFTEVYEILQYLDRNTYTKIPLDLITLIKDNRNINYKYKIQLDKKLKNQNILPETKAILFNIFRDYLSTEEQREKIKQWQLDYLKNIEKNKTINYNTDIFKNKHIINMPVSIKKNDLVKIKKTNLFKKIINKIKNLFKFNI